MEEQPPPTPYGSARDLPSFLDMADHLEGMKLLTRFIGRKHRADLIEIERQLNELADTVDRFYEVLGDRHWVFHETLSLDHVKRSVISAGTPEAAEQELIQLYQQPETLASMTRQLNGLPALRIRQHLIDRALTDYRERRFYATTLVLLTVMDGFVNDVEHRRIGLHARSPEELVAWDSVVGHHKGLSHAHRSFKTSTKKTVADELFELHRNGILHGTILQYDNVIVASKAWNRLFAVADWARSLDRKATPVDPKPSLKEGLQQRRQLSRDKEALADWDSSTLTPSDDAFDKEPITRVVRQFFAAWHQRNYGSMSTFFPDRLLSRSPAAKTAQVRGYFDQSHLEGFRVTQLNFVAAAVCEVDAILQLEEQPHNARLRWVREKPGTTQPAIREEDGEWRLYTWTPQVMIKRDVKRQLDCSK